METNTFGTPALDFSYSTSGAIDIREAIEFAGFEPTVSTTGFFDIDLGDTTVRVAQDDSDFEVIVFSQHFMVEGKMRLSGSLATVAILTAVIAEVTA